MGTPSARSLAARISQLELRTIRTMLERSFQMGQAQKFLDAIKDTLETNGVLKRVFSDVLWQDPKGHAPRWSVARGLVIKRKSKMKEPTIGAYGLLNTMPTGSHFRLRLYDDLVDLKTVTNEEMIKKTTIAYEMSQNLGVESGSREQAAGTRYSFADTYGVIMEREVLVPRIYPATHNGKMDGIPVLMSPAAWAETKNKQRSTVAAQMLLNPLMGSENTFDVRWFKAWEVRPSVLNVYIMCDPSRGRTKTSDRTAIAVIGVDVAGNKYLLDGYRHRMKLSARYDALKQMHKKWTAETGVQVVVMGYERFGQQADDDVEVGFQQLSGVGGGQADHRRVGRQRARSDAADHPAVGEVIEQHEPVGRPQRIVVRQRDDPGAEPDPLGPLRGRRDENLRRADDLAARGVVLTDPDLVVADRVEVLDQLEVTL
jgi:hypothetical protein